MSRLERAALRAAKMGGADGRRLRRAAEFERRIDEDVAVRVPELEALRRDDPEAYARRARRHAWPADTDPAQLARHEVLTALTLEFIDEAIS